MSYTFDMTGDFDDWDWGTLEIDKSEKNKKDVGGDEDDAEQAEYDKGWYKEGEEDVDEGTCGYGKKGKIGKKPAGPSLGFTKRELKEILQRRAGIIK